LKDKFIKCIQYFNPCLSVAECNKVASVTLTETIYEFLEDIHSSINNQRSKQRLQQEKMDREKTAALLKERLHHVFAAKSSVIAASTSESNGNANSNTNFNLILINLYVNYSFNLLLLF